MTTSEISSYKLERPANDPRIRNGDQPTTIKGMWLAGWPNINSAGVWYIYPPHQKKKLLGNLLSQTHASFQFKTTSDCPPKKNTAVLESSQKSAAEEFLNPGNLEVPPSSLCNVQTERVGLALFKSFAKFDAVM